MRYVPLTQGQCAIVDDEDFDRVTAHRWTVDKRKCGLIYVTRRVTINGKHQKIYLHRFVLGVSGGAVDHIDRNGLNNQKCNLRHCTQSQNLYNRVVAKTNKAGFKGVWFWAKRNKFQCKIQIGDKYKTVGYFDSAKDAAMAYDVAALIHHGEFARTNQQMGLL